MYDDFKTANYPNALMSPELYARHLSRMFSGEVIDGFTVSPGTGLQVVLAPGNLLARYGSANVASARLVSLVANFNLTITTPDVSNPRIDLVVVYTDDDTLAANTPDGKAASKALVVAGTPGASPSAPNSAAIQSAVGSGNPYDVVAQVRVEAGVSVIAADKITDVRSFVAPSKTPALGIASHITSGAQWSAGAGLLASMTAGTGYINVGGIMIPITPAVITNHSFTASKDTYVSVDYLGTITYTEVANNASSPTLPANSIWLAIVVTNGSAVTAVYTTNVDTNAKLIRPMAYGTKQTDANGWTIYDMGTYRRYAKRSSSFSFTKVSGEYFTPATTSLPVGIATIGNNTPSGTSMICNFITDTLHGLQHTNTSATSLSYNAQARASATYIGWVDFELRTP
ncbi:hypothetical protein ACWFRF_15410 [Nocardia sp. NPDC055165]